MSDHLTLAVELDRLAADAARIAAKLRRLDEVAYVSESCLTVSQAATICGVTDQAIYNWIEDSARMRRPIAEKRANVWIIDTLRLFAYLEKHRGGPSAKALAEARLKEYWPIWSQK